MNERTPIGVRGHMALVAFTLWLHTSFSTVRTRMQRHQPAWVRGQALVEYVLILALIAVVVFVVLHFLGSKTQNTLGNVANTL